MPDASAESRQACNPVPSWVNQAVVYQIMPDRFCNGSPGNDPQGVRPWGGRPTRRSFFGGDLAGILRRLDYLQDLGIDTIYLTPIFAAPSTHKYDASDYFTIDPAFGTLGEFQELVKEMHARGMRIILDGVFNHCGDRHPAFMSAVRDGPQSPTWDWFFFYGYPVRKRPKPNYAHGGIYYLPKWNLRNPEVRRHLQDAIRYWTEQGIDGWRLDVPWYVEEHEFWREMRALVRSINPEAYMVGEHWGDASPWLNAEEFDGATDYRLRNAILRYLAGEDGEVSSSELAATMKSLLADYPWPNRLAMWNLLGSHDTPRVATILRGNVARVMLGFVIAFTFPGVPQLYYGDEVGMRGQNDPDCRRCFPWDESTWAHELRRFVQHLTRIRRRYPALQHGQMRILYSHGGVLVYQRGTGSESILVVIGNGQDEGELQLPPLDNVRTNTPYAWRELLRWDDYEVSPRPGRGTWEAGTRLRNENRPRAWVFAAARPEDVGESSAPGTPQPAQVRVFRSSPDL